MDFELSSEFSRIQAIPHFTIFAKKSGLTRDWIQETLSTKMVFFVDYGPKSARIATLRGRPPQLLLS